MNNNYDFLDAILEDDETGVPPADWSRLFEVPIMDYDHLFEMPANDAERFVSWLGFERINVSFMNSETRVFSGGSYPSEKAGLIAERSNANDKIEGVWIGVNPPLDSAIDKPKLSNADIARRLHLVFDLDPNDKKAPPSDKLEALKRLDAILDAFGFDNRIVIDSGNGGLIVAKVDLPNSDSYKGSKGKIQRLYAAINAKLQADGFDWHVDAQCKDAARIVGLPGSTNRKPGYPASKRSIIRELDGEPMSEAGFDALIETLPEIARPKRVKSAEAPSPSEPLPSVSSDEFSRSLLWAMIYEEFGEDDIERMKSILEGTEFEVLDDDGEGVIVRSPLADQYSTPEGDRDSIIYPSFGYSFLHETDQAFAWDGPEDFLSQYRPDFYSKYLSRLEEKRAEFKRKANVESEYFKPSSAPLIEAKPDDLSDEDLADIMATEDAISKTDLSADAFGPEICNIADTILDDLNYKEVGGALLFCLMPFLGMAIGKRILIREKRFDMARGSFRYCNSTVIYNDKTSGAKTKAIEALVKEQYGEVEEFSASGSVIELGNSMNDVVEQCGYLINKTSRDAADQKSEAERDCRLSMDGFLVNADDDIEGFGKLSGNKEWNTKKQHLNMLTSGADLSLHNKMFFRVYLDSCISMIVSGQPERLLQEFPFDSKNIDSGLSGRCVYYSGGFPYEYVEGRGDNARKQAVYKRIRKLRDSGCFFEVSFNDVDVSEIFENKRESYRRFARMNPDIAEKFRAKFRDIAALWSAIRAVCEKDIEYPASGPAMSPFVDDLDTESDDSKLKPHNGKEVRVGLDASEYFYKFYDLLFDSLGNYFLDISQADPFGQRQRSILLDIYKRPNRTVAKSELKKRYGSGRNYHEYADIMQYLEDGGLVQTRTTKGSRKLYVVLTDRGAEAVESMFDAINVGELQ